MATCWIRCVDTGSGVYQVEQYEGGGHIAYDTGTGAQVADPALLNTVFTMAAYKRGLVLCPEQAGTGTTTLNVSDAEYEEGCILDAAGATVQTAHLKIVTDENGVETSRGLVDPVTGTAITLGAGQTFGPCGSTIPSHIREGCLVDTVAQTKRAATQEIP